MTKQDELDRLWSDPAHWTRDGAYRCAADPRTMVLKRVGIGYTINTAHRRSWLMLGGLVAISIAPILVSLVFGRRVPGWFMLVTLLLPIAVAVITLVWLSHRDNP